MSEATAIGEQLVHYLCLQLRDTIDAQTDLIDSGLIDSLLLTDLVSFIQARFAVMLTSEDVTPVHFRNVAALAALIMGRRAIAANRAA